MKEREISDMWKVPYPFDDKPNEEPKPRPVVIIELDEKADKVIGIKCTTKNNRINKEKYKYTLTNRPNGISKDNIVICNRMAEINNKNEKNFIRYYGKVSDFDMRNIIDLHIEAQAKDDIVGVSKEYYIINDIDDSIFKESSIVTGDTEIIVRDTKLHRSLQGFLDDEYRNILFFIDDSFTRTNDWVYNGICNAYNGTKYVKLDDLIDYIYDDIIDEDPSSNDITQDVGNHFIENGCEDKETFNRIYRPFEDESLKDHYSEEEVFMDMANIVDFIRKSYNNKIMIVVNEDFYQYMIESNVNMYSYDKIRLNEYKFNSYESFESNKYVMFNESADYDDKAKEGAITWQADKNGQGKYDSEAPTDPTTPISPTQPQEPATPVTPVNPGNNGIQQGDYDTPHMRGVRGAVLSNIGAFRMMTDDMYRTRTLQQGAPVGIWANINTGRYDFSTTGVSNESEYTRFRGGFDKQFGTLIVGGQIEYLRGDDDFNDTGAIRSGSGKERAFMGGIYATKDIGNDAYVHVETKAGRLSNDFTVYNEVGNALSGKTSSTGYSVATRVGKQVKFSKGLYVEPQAQLAYMHLSGDSFNAGAMHVNQSSVNSTVGKLGVEVGKLFGAGNLYTRFSVGHAFTGNVETTYTSGSIVKTTDNDVKGSWIELAFGGRYGLNANNSIFADVSAGLSGDYKQHWGFNAGFSHKF